MTDLETFRNIYDQWGVHYEVFKIPTARSYLIRVTSRGFSERCVYTDFKFDDFGKHISMESYYRS